MAPAAPRPVTPSAWRHLPNAISVLRIVLVLPIALAIEARWFREALVLTAVAGISDGVDGFLARHFNWRSRLGSILDPTADKLLLVTCFVVLAVMGIVPLALVVLVLGRDLVIAVGAVAWMRVLGHFRAAPSWLSKICTTVQILYVLAVLLRQSGWWDNSPGMVLAWLVAALTLVSGLDYIVRWGLAARRELAARHAQGEPHDS